MAKLRNLLPWRRHRLEHDLDRELRYHNDRRVLDLMESGLDKAAAQRRAAIEFGGVDQVEEEVRETWTWRARFRMGARASDRGATLRRSRRRSSDVRGRERFAGARRARFRRVPRMARCFCEPGGRAAIRMILDAQCHNQLAVEKESWDRLTAAVQVIFDEAG